MWECLALNSVPRRIQKNCQLVRHHRLLNAQSIAILLSNSGILTQPTQHKNVTHNRLLSQPPKYESITGYRLVPKVLRRHLRTVIHFIFLSVFFAAWLCYDEVACRECGCGGRLAQGNGCLMSFLTETEDLMMNDTENSVFIVPPCVENRVV